MSWQGWKKRGKVKKQEDNYVNYAAYNKIASLNVRQESLCEERWLGYPLPNPGQRRGKGGRSTLLQPSIKPRQRTVVSVGLKSDS